MKALVQAIADRLAGKTPKIIKRSSKWPRVRMKFLYENPSCAICLEQNEHRLDVHHIMPFHLDRTLELEPSNLITLCSEDSHDCHFRFGHLSNWRKFNPEIQTIKDKKMNWFNDLFWVTLGLPKPHNLKGRS